MPTLGAWKKKPGANIALTPNFNGLKVQRPENFIAAKSGSKGTRKAEFWQISQEHQNHAFSEILQKGNQRKIVQKVGRLRGLEKHPSGNPAIS